VHPLRSAFKVKKRQPKRSRIAVHPLRSAFKVKKRQPKRSRIAAHPLGSALKIPQTKKRSSKLGVFSNLKDLFVTSAGLSVGFKGTVSEK
jgi:hypothetical protein